eukprot:Sdes_comp19970_c0_seq1m12533
MMVGATKGKKYIQPEGELASAMIKGGHSLSEDSFFANTLLFCGEFENQIAEARDRFDSESTEYCLKPLNDYLARFKAVEQHRKKLESRRLNYDHWKGKEAKIDNDKDREEFRIAQEKFEQSKEVTHNGMVELLQQEAENIHRLSSFIDAQYAFHSTCVDILGQLSKDLQQRANQASAQPREFSKYENFSGIEDSPHRRNSNCDDSFENRNQSPSPTKPVPPPRAGGRNLSSGRRLRALYQFDAENSSELSFREGDIINMHRQLDSNWYEGELNGRVGIFPTNYVEMI